MPRGRRRGFSPSSSVSSSITHVSVILVFASLFPTPFLLIAAMFVINYGLECFVNLGIVYIYHSTHQLFEYMLVLVFFFFFLIIGGSEHSLVFYTLSELSHIYFMAHTNKFSSPVKKISN